MFDVLRETAPNSGTFVADGSTTDAAPVDAIAALVARTHAEGVRFAIVAFDPVRPNINLPFVEPRDPVSTVLVDPPANTDIPDAAREPAVALAS